jgi:hypothetical protein
MQLSYTLSLQKSISIRERSEINGSQRRTDPIYPQLNRRGM